MVNMSLQDACEDSEQLLEHLRNEHCGMEHVQTHEALQYLNVLKTARAAKAEVEHHILALPKYYIVHVICGHIFNRH